MVIARLEGENKKLKEEKTEEIKEQAMVIERLEGLPMGIPCLQMQKSLWRFFWGMLVVFVIVSFKSSFSNQWRWGQIEGRDLSAAPRA